MNVKINGKQYSWADVRVNVLGRTLQGISEIDYDDQEDVTSVKGSGKYPLGYTQGNYKATAKMTLWMSEVEALSQSLPEGKRLQDIAPFDITVVYLDDETGNLVTHTLKTCKITKRSQKAGNGNAEAIAVPLELFVSTINWNKK
jgi:hypothetical protein